MTAKSSYELVIVMPIYNEEESIGTVLQTWFEELDHLQINAIVYAINDGSGDGTGAVLRDFETRQPTRLVLFDKPNSGHGRTCRFGYDRACQTNVEWVLQIDSDGQCDPVYFKSFWTRREEADCLIGLRTTRGDSRARRFVSIVCTALTSLVTGQTLLDPNVPYRLIRRSVLSQALRLVPPDFDVHNVALLLALKRNKRNRFCRIPIHFPPRQAGHSSIDFPKIIRMGPRMLLELSKVGHPQDL